MSTTIGNRMINGYSGSGVKYHSTGGGVARNIASSVVGTIGHALVNKLATAVKGSGYRITGEGKKKKAGRPKKTGKKRC